MSKRTIRDATCIDSPQQEAFLALWRSYDRLRAFEDELFAGFDLTAQQYNLLRLLRPSQPDLVPASRLMPRLVSRAPDVTRKFDRLEDRKRIVRTRTSEDRRAVLIGVTGTGLALFKQIADPLRACHQRQLGHLSSSELRHLVELLQKARVPHEPSGSPWK